MSLSRPGRADLVKAMSYGREHRTQLAEMLGYEFDPKDVDVGASGEESTLSTDWNSSSSHSAEPGRQQTIRCTAFQPDSLEFWQPVRFRLCSPTPDDSTTGGVEITTAGVGTGSAAPRVKQHSLYETLAPLPEVLSQLRQLTELERPGDQPDIPRLIDDFCRGRLRPHVPRLPRRGLGSCLHVVQDRSPHLTPYDIDQGILSAELKDRMPKTGLTVSTVRDGDLKPEIHWPNADDGGASGDSLEHLTAPEADSVVLALTDLGALHARGDPLIEAWLRYGELLANRHVRRVALVPCGVEAIPAELSRVWTVVPWNSSHRPARPLEQYQRELMATRLLALLSFAVTIEPRLLRLVRCSVPELRPYPELESLVWQHAALLGSAREGIAIAQTHRDSLNMLRQNHSAEERRAAIEYAVAEHAGDFEGLRHVEVLNLGREYFSDEVIEAARAWFQEIDTVELPTDPDRLDRIEFFRVIAPHCTSGAFKRCPALNRIWSRHLRRQRPGDFRVAVGHGTAGFEFIRLDTQSTAFLNASPIADLHSRSGRIDLLSSGDHDVSFDPVTDFWADGEHPSWAADWGIDEFGLWVELRFPRAVDTDQTQHLRWIPAGKFVMGSPKGEPGRYNDEGPQHEVTITQGFWMFDTPCMQAFYHAVTGENPSHFKSPDRPVETVSWEDAQAFLNQLRTDHPGIEIGLPTEAEWEYACRAGTTDATYAGPIDILGDANAPVLDDIAWYGGNSNVGFELEGGIELGHFEDRQHGDKGERAGTHPARRKTPNPWGLYDMLGNVYEWCDDTSDDGAYKRGNSVDPAGQSSKASAYRVIRGGGWHSDARYVRAAYRYWYPPERRRYGLGFRCRVRGAEPSQVAAEQAEQARKKQTAGQGGVERAASGRSERSRGDSSAASEQTTWIQLIDRQEASTPVPQGPVAKIFSDVEELTLRRIARPDWAYAMGRDEFGLWVDLKVDGQAAKDTASAPRVRLRWIPPGRFMMGSPKGEPGRWDEGEFEPHSVVIPDGFWLFETPVTQALWELVMGEDSNESEFRGDARPVERVTWRDCRKFCSKLSDMTAVEVALPSEEEWEYACRAGTTAATYAGEFEGDSNTQAILDSIAWYGGNRNANEGTRPVGGKAPNPWGLYDMLGNVYEWCSDVGRLPNEVAREEVDESSAHRVIRGGGWGSDARLACVRRSGAGTRPGTGSTSWASAAEFVSSSQESRSRRNR